MFNVNKLSVDQSLKCELWQLKIIFDYKKNFRTILVFWGVPLGKLLELDLENNLKSLLENIHTKTSRLFLDQYTTPAEILNLSENCLNSLTQEQWALVDIKYVEIKEILNVFAFDPDYLFNNENKEFLELAMPYILRVKDLLFFDEIIPSEDALSFMRKAVVLVNEFKPEEIEVIKIWPPSVRKGIFENFDMFCSYIRLNNIDLSGDIFDLIDEFLNSGEEVYDINEFVEVKNEFVVVDEDEELYKHDLWDDHADDLENMNMESDNSDSEPNSKNSDSDSNADKYLN